MNDHEWMDEQMNKQALVLMDMTVERCTKRSTRYNLGLTSDLAILIEMTEPQFPDTHCSAPSS